MERFSNIYIPNIRFKGFTDDWEQRKVGDTNTFFTDGNYGEAYPKASDMTDSSNGIPFLTGGNLKGGKLDITGASYITPEKHAKLTSGHLIEDDIVIAVRGSLGALGYVKSSNSGWNINSQLAILRTDKSVLSGKYLIQFLLSGIGQKELLIRQTGSALKQLPIGAVKDVPIPITSVEEQGKIGEFFEQLDNLITLHQRKCEEIKELKKYMLQKMFPKNGEKKPEIRFENFTDDWEQRKLGEVFEEYSEKNHEELPALTIIQGGGTVRRDESDRAIQYDKASLSNYKMVRKDDFILHLRSFEGGLERATCDGIISPAYHTFHGDEADSRFYYAFFRSYDFIKRKLVPHIYGIRDGKSIDVDGLKSIKVPYPSYDEQRKIGDFLEEMDNLITLHQRKCEEIIELKKYMLQNMFPQKKQD